MLSAVGIDLGLDGGLAYWDERKGLTIEPMPTVGDKRRDINAPAVCSWLLALKAEGQRFEIWIEDVAARPKQGVSSMFRFGEGAGIIKGICAALALPVRTVSPRVWQRHIIGTFPKGESKGYAARTAARLFPDVDFRISARASKPHEGMVDAALIAYYGARAGLYI